ncbi:MAG: GxxExxY protein [Verrucomicrobia bacterium]|nr:GxxExxY protein [Verrucomicrobiota bacterium]
MSTLLIHEKDTYAILGACFEVYNEKGCGFTEDVYQECLEIELELKGIPFVAQKELPLTYKGRRLKRKFRADFVCFEHVLLEIKAVSQLVDEHRSQVLNYLHATTCPVGLLVNFGHFPKVEYERLVLTKKRTVEPQAVPDFKL